MAANRIPTTCLCLPSMQCMEGERCRFGDRETGAFASLFNPRRQRWDDHFVLRVAVIEPRTAEGRATARLLKLNLDKRVVERQLLAASVDTLARAAR